MAKKELKEGKITVQTAEEIEKCRKHRETLNAPKEDVTTPDLYCDNYRQCWEGCPLPLEKRHVKPKCKKCGKEFRYPSRGDGLCDPCHYAECKPKNAGINRSIFEEIEPEDKDNKKIDVKIRRKIESFLWMQSRVIDKLSRHPEIYKLLDELTSAEITARLSEVKTSISSVVPAQFGGKMTTVASKETKKMFEKLEKQYAEEDEKKGKPEPKSFDKEGFSMEWSEDEGFTGRGFPAKDLFPKKEGAKKKNDE